MVRISKFDIVIIFTSAMGMIFLSFIAPAAGLADQSNNTTESEIPEFNITSDKLNISGDFPEQPGTPTSGTIERFENQTILGEHIAWIDRPKDMGTSIELTNFSGDMKVNINNWTSGNSVAKDLYNITEEGQIIRHSNNSWGIEFTVEHYANHAEPNMSAIVDWEVLESPQGDEGGFLEALPVIGWLWGAGEYLALTLAYIGDIILWGVGAFIEGFVAAAGAGADLVVYIVDMFVFITSTYNSLIGGASSGWSAAIVAIPGILFYTEFAKMALVALQTVRG